jgi:hypothetical protein
MDKCVVKFSILWALSQYMHNPILTLYVNFYAIDFSLSYIEKVPIYVN